LHAAFHAAASACFVHMRYEVQEFKLQINFFVFIYLRVV